MKRLYVVWATVVLAPSACKSGDTPRSNGTGELPMKAATAEAPAESARPAPRDPPGAGGNAVKWPDSVQWRGWEEGLKIARAESKPIMVVVYADWCPKCRSLAPIFGDPEVAALAKKFVMVRQNHDDDPEWLRPMNGKLGSYVPRIFFFDENAKLREDVTSGHPRYPYFYAAQQPEFLKTAMRRATGA